MAVIAFSRSWTHSPDVSSVRPAAATTNRSPFGENCGFCSSRSSVRISLRAIRLGQDQRGLRVWRVGQHAAARDREMGCTARSPLDRHVLDDGNQLTGDRATRRIERHREQRGLAAHEQMPARGIPGDDPLDHAIGSASAHQVERVDPAALVEEHGATVGQDLRIEMAEPGVNGRHRLRRAAAGVDDSQRRAVAAGEHDAVVAPPARA